MTFGEKLQRLRAREGLSQDALAELLDVSRQAVSRWERDETMPETEKVIRISDYFHVTTDYLLKDGPEHFPPSSRPLPDPGEIWRKYGFLLAWAVALWGVTVFLRLLPMAVIVFGLGNWLVSICVSIVRVLPGAAITAAGALWALRWQRAGRFRRQDLGWALALGGRADAAPHVSGRGPGPPPAGGRGARRPPLRRIRREELSHNTGPGSPSGPSPTPEAPGGKIRITLYPLRPSGFPPGRSFFQKFLGFPLDKSEICAIVLVT